MGLWWESHACPDKGRTDHLKCISLSRLLLNISNPDLSTAVLPNYYCCHGSTHEKMLFKDDWSVANSDCHCRLCRRLRLPVGCEKMSIDITSSPATSYGMRQLGSSHGRVLQRFVTAQHQWSPITHVQHRRLGAREIWQQTPRRTSAHTHTHIWSYICKIM